MRKAALFFLCIIFLSSCGKDKETNQPQVTSYAEQVLARKKDNPPPPKVDNSEQEKKESYMEAPLMPAKVVVMPMACVNGSYAPGNYQNRHYFPALVNTLLEMYGNIRTPRRSAVIDAALEKKLIAPNFQARRRKTYNLIETANFGNEIKAELLDFHNDSPVSSGMFGTGAINLNVCHKNTFSIRAMSRKTGEKNFTSFTRA